MPSQVIPCSKCAETKKKIEAPGGFKVIDCKPVSSKPGWCDIRYERVPPGPGGRPRSP